MWHSAASAGSANVRVQRFTFYLKKTRQRVLQHCKGFSEKHACMHQPTKIESTQYAQSFFHERSTNNPSGRMISLQDIMQAKESISELVKKTPLKHSTSLSRLCGGEVYLKLENQQVTNSFKIRGAFNRLKQLKTEDTECGVITASAGNHGLAVALSAEQLKIRAKIVVPRSTPQIKVDRI